jgi:hypothetical protein
VTTEVVTPPLDASAPLIDATLNPTPAPDARVAERPQDTRTFTHFTDAAEEVVVARVYEGIHFNFADEDARKQGKRVANWAFENFLRPVGQ